MTNLNYKDESKLVNSSSEVFNDPNSGCWKMKGKEKPTEGRSRKKGGKVFSTGKG